MKNAFTQTRKFMIARWGLTEMEATTLITQAVDFGMTQLVDGNWGVHGIIPKNIFTDWEGTEKETSYAERVALVYCFVSFVGLMGVLF